MQIAGIETGRHGLSPDHATPWGRPLSRCARALARHQRARLEKARTRRLSTWARDLPPAQRARAAGRLATTPCPCSCWMCGNPRRHFGNTALARTRQEQAACLDLHEGCTDGFDDFADRGI